MKDVLIPEDRSRLEVLEGSIDAARIVDALKKDLVVLVKGCSPERADEIVHTVADAVDLAEALMLQAGFAEIRGHRKNVGEYFMTVNARDDYQFIPPHSEGNSSNPMQLATFYCFENTTDGGDTILLNIDQESNGWPALRERVKRVRLSRALQKHEAVQVKGLYQVDPSAVLVSGETVLEEVSTNIPGLTIVDALAPLKKVRSILLEREVNAYWDTVASIDIDAAPQFERLLRQHGLLKEPSGGLDLRRLDNAAERRIWASKVPFESLFKRMLTYKLVPGDLVLLNNLSWAHSVSNWTPGSGTRRLTGAFA